MTDTMDINELKTNVNEIRSKKEAALSKFSINERLKDMLEDYSDGTVGMTEEEKKQHEQDIYAKYKAGRKLSSKEMSYLARTNPELYMHARRIQLMREVLEHRLKHCNSKQQAEELMDKAHSMIDDNDPDKLVLHAAYDDVWHEFKKSSKYAGLPEKADEADGIVITFSYVPWEEYYYENYNEYNYMPTAELAPTETVASFQQMA